MFNNRIPFVWNRSWSSWTTSMSFNNKLSLRGNNQTPCWGSPSKERERRWPSKLTKNTGGYFRKHIISSTWGVQNLYLPTFQLNKRYDYTFIVAFRVEPSTERTKCWMFSKEERIERTTNFCSCQRWKSWHARG